MLIRPIRTCLVIDIQHVYYRVTYFIQLTSSMITISADCGLNIFKSVKTSLYRHPLEIYYDLKFLFNLFPLLPNSALFNKLKTK